jgi:hypothetical protein
MSVLIIAAASIAGIWLVVILASPMFGSDH